MQVEHIVFIIISILLLTSEVLGVLSLQSTKSSLRKKLFYLSIALVWLWLLFNLLELLASSEQWTVFFMKVSFIPMMFVPPTLVWFSHAYVGLDRNKLIKRLYILFTILIVFMLTNELHSWFWQDSSFTQYSSLLRIENIYGKLVVMD